jgi:Uma2 family endonuclease
MSHPTTRPTLDDPAIRIPARAATLAGFRAWALSDEFPERGRFSFINGELFVDMSPEEVESHNKVKTEVSRVLCNLNEGLDLGEFFGDGTLVTSEAADLSTEPDGTFVTWRSFEEGRVRLTPREDRPGQYTELQGTPDWVLEVVSRSSMAKDTRILREAYHRAGVPEYWIIDARFDAIDFQVLRRRRDRYVVAAPRGGWHRSSVFGRRFRLERRLNRMGRWRYTLLVAPA